MNIPQDDALAKTLSMSNQAKLRNIWLQNVRDNLPEIARGKDIKPLENLFAGVPGIVVGAGPSLAKNIGLLAANAQRYPLFCTDRAFAKLHAAGIIPQFTVVVDFQKQVADFFTGMPIHKTILLGSIKISNKVVALTWKKKIFYAVFDNDEKFNEVQVNLTQHRVDSLPGAVICGNTAYLLARLAGCNPVTFVGCDMSMKEPSPDPTDMNFEATDINGDKIYSLPYLLI